MSLHELYKIKQMYGIQTSSQEEGVTMSVFLQMSPVGIGDILCMWALRSTLRTHTPCEGG